MSRSPLKQGLDQFNAQLANQRHPHDIRQVSNVGQANT
jgi:hypothetical protein